MKNLRSLLVAFAIIMSTALYANPDTKLKDENAVSAEIENLLDSSCYSAEKNITITVFFSLSDDGKIQSISVASPNEEVNQYLQKRLGDQELEGDFWKRGKIYELSVTRRVA